MASVKVWYDRDGDFLEITFDDAAAITDEVAEGSSEPPHPGWSNSGLWRALF